jgi:hypothetical protein
MYVIWEQSKTIKRIHLLNLKGENSPKGIQKPSQNDHLSINATCIRMSTWKNYKKVQSLGLVCNIKGKVGNSHLI